MTINIHVPDIGDFDSVEIIEVLVKEGDSINIDDPINSMNQVYQSPVCGTFNPNEESGSFTMVDNNKVAQTDAIN